MRRVLMMALASAAFAAATPALADTALHGYCNSTAPCSDNGTNTPTSVNPPQFGFWLGSGGATGDLLIDILVPNNDTGLGPFTFNGYKSGTASLFSSTAWTSNDLASYLGLANASPNNPIGAYLPSTKLLDPSASGFFVFQANVPNVTLPSAPTNADLMTLQQGLPIGSYILAFLGQTVQQCTHGPHDTTVCTDVTDYNATANSGAILETHAPVPEPATWGMMLLGFAGIGFAVRRSPRAKALTQVA